MSTIEEVQEYWDKRPCNVRHSSAPIGSLEYATEVTIKKMTVEPHIIDFCQLDRWQGARVLEVGCGIGVTSALFAAYGADVTAVDLSPESLKIAEKNVDAMGYKDSVTFLQANAERLSETVPIEKYDLIYSFGVLHHTPRPRSAFRELSYYCHDNTLLKFMVYNRHSTKAFGLTKGRLWRDDLIAKGSEAESHCPITYAYTKQSVRKLIFPFFQVEKAWIDHIFPYTIEPYVNGRYERKLWTTVPGFHQFEKRFGWHLLVDARPY